MRINFIDKMLSALTLTHLPSSTPLQHLFLSATSFFAILLTFSERSSINFSWLTSSQSQASV